MSNFRHIPGLRNAKVLIASAPLLVPGAGWGGATSTPSAVGGSPTSGYDATAIARWNVVPWQTFGGILTIGIVAFHINGIALVEFAVNGGAWVSRTAMEWNPDSRTWEYCVRLRASDFADGLIEVRARITPATAGLCRVLQGDVQSVASSPTDGMESCWLYANSGATLTGPIKWADSVNGNDTTGDGSEGNPRATIYKAMMDVRAAAGSPNYCSFGTVYLKAGDYNWSGRNSYSGDDADADTGWLTVSGAPGVDPTSVRITASSDIHNPRSAKSRLRNLCLRTTPTSSAAIPQAWWHDNITIGGNGRTSSVPWPSAANAPAGIWVTDCNIENTGDSVWAARITRNTSVRNIGQNAFQNTGLVVNCTCDGIDKTGTSFHPDIFHWEGPDIENVIVYNVLAINSNGQGLFSRGAAAFRAVGTPPDTDVAIVNVVMDGMPSYNTSWEHPASHLLIWHVTQWQTNFNLADEPAPVEPWDGASDYHNLSIRGCLLPTCSWAPTGTISFDRCGSNHFLAGSTYGSDATSGSSIGTLVPGYASKNFTPTTGNALDNRVTQLVLVDVHNRRRKAMSSVGAVEAL